MKSLIRVRIGTNDANYGKNLVDGSKILKLFKDAAAEILIKHDGDEGLFRAYDNIEFLAPVYAGDYIEVNGELISFGTTSRKMNFEARKVIQSVSDINDSSGEVLLTPIVVCKASGTCVVPKDKQKNR